MLSHPDRKPFPKIVLFRGMRLAFYARVWDEERECHLSSVGRGEWRHSPCSDAYYGRVLSNEENAILAQLVEVNGDIHHVVMLTMVEF